MEITLPVAFAQRELDFPDFQFVGIMDLDCSLWKTAFHRNHGTLDYSCMMIRFIRHAQ